MFILLHPSCQSYVLVYWTVLLARTNSKYFSPVLLQMETVPPARLLVWLRVLTGWFGWVGTLRCSQVWVCVRGLLHLPSSELPSVSQSLTTIRNIQTFLPSLINAQSQSVWFSAVFCEWKWRSWGLKMLECGNPPSLWAVVIYLPFPFFPFKTNLALRLLRSLFGGSLRGEASCVLFPFFFWWLIHSDQTSLIMKQQI